MNDNKDTWGGKKNDKTNTWAHAWKLNTINSTNLKINDDVCQLVTNKMNYTCRMLMQHPNITTA